MSNISMGNVYYLRIDMRMESVEWIEVHGSKPTYWESHRVFVTRGKEFTCIQEFMDEYRSRGYVIFEARLPRTSLVRLNQKGGYNFVT